MKINLGRAPEVRYNFKKNKPTKSHKKKTLLLGESFKKCWVTYFLLGNGDGFGHDFLAIDHLDFLLHFFID